ncbi:hypothetical protein I7X12_05975 [Halosimplex litoreum]|uniref:Halobacterial output domain-containing protein n=1 Tax=Halosimplex litoreum TaxID=1198301 RepID=A0A7T3KWA1_9EURY|nr:HalOD1 output domain-containing protein [Halosimplex litoreum]QPV64169.1 hypothetical protein I7X12_05975 [Halosimplex litoreum]
MGELENPISRISDAVGEAEGTGAVDLKPPRTEIIDPDALGTFLEDTTPSGLEVRFTYRGHDVVDESGHVRVG